MKFMCRKIAAPGNLRVIIVVLTVFWYTLIPAIYVLNLIGADKTTVFICLITTSLLTMLFGLFFRGTADRDKLAIFVLYLLFAAYAALSYLFASGYKPDFQTLVVLCFLNPLIVLLSTSCSQYKTVVFGTMYFFGLVYLLQVGFLHTTGSFGEASGFNKVFSTVDGAAYQNVTQYLGLLAVLSIAFATGKKKLLSYLHISLIFFVLYLMFVIGGRSSIVSVIAVLLLAFQIQKSLTVLVSIIFLVLFGGLGLFLLFPEIAAHSVFDSNLIGVRRFAVLVEGGDRTGRLSLFSAAIELFLSSPKNFFFGGGMTSYPVFVGSNSPGMYPHNLILELLSEYGVVGFSLFIAPVIYLFKRRKDRIGNIVGNNTTEKTAFYVFLYFLTISMFSGGLRVSWVLVFVIFLLFVDKTRTTKKHSPASCVLKDV